MDIDVSSYIEFDFSNAYKGGEMWSGQREFEQKFLNWYSYLPETVLTRFETVGDKFTASLNGHR